MNGLLDDAAAYATEGQRIDLDQVRRRIAQQQVAHRRQAWRRTGLAALAVAAVTALLVVLFPPSGVLRGDAGPAAPAPLPARTGLPSSWYDAPVWTPPVTRHPMTAAVMVLQAPVQTGPVRNRSFAAGPVLVSADGRTYASVPGWSAADGGLTLSRDGRQIAWWTQPASRTAKLVVHRLVLATGQQRDIRLHPGTPQSMTFAGDDLYVSGVQFIQYSAGADPPDLQTMRRLQRDPWDGVYRISRSGAVSTACFCDPAQLGSSDDGRLLQAQTRHGAGVSRAAQLWDSNREVGSAAAEGDSGVAARTLLPSPDGQHTAGLVRDAKGNLVIRLRASPSLGLALTVAALKPPGASFPIRPAGAVGSISPGSLWLLGWTDAGVLLRVQTPEGLSVQSLDPKTGAMTVISRAKDTSRTLPILVAPELIRSARTIAAPQPSFAGRDRSHLTFLASDAWSTHRGRSAGVLALAVILGAGLLIGRRRSAK